ncbi:MAG: sulfatase [Verrucomicrobiales bacterium]|nr:sulfatase [Verrucomicrobiales bacterium]
MDQAVTQRLTRRHFFRDCGVGLGSVALGNLLGRDAQAAVDRSLNPLAVASPHRGARAKNVIFMFMAGGPSQLELFDHKPKLREWHGKPSPDSFFPKEKSFAFIKKGAKILGGQQEFGTHGQTGVEISKLLPHLASVSDEVCFLKGMVTDVFNHGPAKLFMNSGFNAPGRPSMGSWLTYGLGSESQDLPGFVVLQSGPRGPRAGNALWSSGFLPTSYQGVPFRGTGDPILNLTSPKGFDSAKQKDFFDLVGKLNRERLDITGDPEIATRINAYEMAYRMQTSAPELMDIESESKSVLKAYGAEPGKNSFANNCLLARRLVERGVRFVQMYHTDWDDHGNPNNYLGAPLEKRCKEIDQPSVALVNDLKQRGLLDDTIVIWGGEFGRTPMGEERKNLTGRDHHISAFTMWAAGGGIKPGAVYGKTDEFGFGVVDEKVHVHDLHATLLDLLGFDHEKLTYRFQGRDYRLTDVHGHIVQDILA